MAENSGGLELRALLFDIDGTLADTDAIHYECFVELCEEHVPEVECTRDFYVANVSGFQNADIAKNLLKHMPFEEAMRVLMEKEAIFRRMSASKLTPLPGLVETLEFAKKHGVKIAAVTNAPKLNAEVILDAIGVTKYFDTVVLAEDCRKPKPAPEPYQKAMKIFGIEDPKQCLVFEDSIAGLQAGVAAGVQSVGVLTSQTREKMGEAGAYHCIMDYTELNLGPKFLDFGQLFKPRQNEESQGKEEEKR